MVDNPYEPPRESSPRGPAPQAEPSCRVVSLRRGILRHFLVAFLVGPYLIGVVITLSDGSVFQREYAVLIVVLGPIFLLLFALPFTVPFTLLTLPLAIMIWKIEDQRTRFFAFLASGAAAGGLIGVWGTQSPDFDARLFVPGTILAGLICGYLETRVALR
ncbi:MAG: hypothetical protein HQ567_02845 [Candidatus Nealsonbacteria bacterium]|nr:hypothetical protein [Candidatus Nealsonbacteria bacterium]